ncbi:MAG: hypothetical protein PHF37_02465 [Phycisphaerae bacterium]|nr:hypothetical protein [Phycisphaerae bacterium]
MNSILPIGSLKRDEIYSFIGGFFIALLWHIYFITIFKGESLSSIDILANPFFLLFWLSSTAALFTIQLLLTFVTAIIIKCRLKGETQEKKLKILNLTDPVENFIFADFVNEVKTGMHLIGIIIIALPLSLFPLYKLASPVISQNICRSILLVIAIAYVCLLFFFVKFWKMFIAIYLLKMEGLVELIDQNTFIQERAIFAANGANEHSKKKLQNYLNQ